MNEKGGYYIQNGTLQLLIMVAGLILQGAFVIAMVSGRLVKVETQVEQLRDDVKEIKGAVGKMDGR